MTQRAIHSGHCKVSGCDVFGPLESLALSPLDNFYLQSGTLGPKSVDSSTKGDSRFFCTICPSSPHHGGLMVGAEV